MELVKNIQQMYEGGDGHVRVLAASIRNLNHLLYCFALKTDLATVPGKILEEWAAQGFPMPKHDFVYKAVDSRGTPLKAIPYRQVNLADSWEKFDVSHELTTQGIAKFVADYESTLRHSA